MTDYLMDPDIGKTTYKINGNAPPNSSTLWPSSKIKLQDTLYGSGGSLNLTTSVWTLVYNGVSMEKSPPVISNGLYHISIRHEQPNILPTVVPFPQYYRVNNIGAKIVFGFVYYLNYFDLSVFLSLKAGDTIEFLGTPTIEGTNLYPKYSVLKEWMIRKVSDV